MLDGYKYAKYILILMLVFAIIAPFMIYANTYEELPKMERVYPEETITIPFEKPLSPKTITKENIYVTDSNDDKVPVLVTIGEDFKSIIVKPDETEYKSGETYTLYINKGVKYLTGRSLEPGLKMEFNIPDIVPEKLPVIGTVENLERLLEESTDDIIYYDGLIRGKAPMDFATNTTAMESVKAEAPKMNKQKADEASPDYSATNVQVQGVDEADIVKTDGEYLYQVNNDKIVIAKIYPSNEMKLIKTLRLEEDKLYPIELYVDKERLIVIGSSSNDIPIYRPMAKSIAIYPPRYNYGTVKLIEYDIKNKSNIKKSREIELEGSYLSSRKIGDMLYLVSNKHFGYYRIMDKANDNYTPSYRDTALKEDFINIPLEKIYYFPDCIGTNYLIVAAVDFGKPNEGINVSTYLGNGENIYASPDNLYVAVTKRVIKPKDPIIYDSANPKEKANFDYNDRETMVYRFTFKGSDLNYTGKGIVPGDILNQFSMDENGEYFRIATTKGEVWREDERTSKNNLYVLDKDMKITGSIEDIAPGEKIYSVRFMGDRAYIVTFKTVDPLFVIDLKDAKKPEILGALKIPGYSDYLHPYDEDHIIGFGKDTIEVINKDNKGNELGRTVHYLGMKMALFDVSDVSNPKEKYSEKIGDRGTESELLHNHKALLFSKEKNLLAFPVTLMEVKDEDKGLDGTRIPKYGEFTFQGALVYNIDLENGFKLKSKISHINDEEYLKSATNWYRSSNNVERIIYIGDDLYTLSKGMIKAHDLDSMKQKGELKINID